MGWEQLQTARWSAQAGLAAIISTFVTATIVFFYDGRTAECPQDYADRGQCDLAPTTVEFDLLRIILIWLVIAGAIFAALKYARKP